MIGHRQRLKERFLKGGTCALPLYELLELVLYIAIPRKDVKPLAKRLVERYGTLQHLCGAPVDELKAFDGLGEGAIHVIKLLHALALTLSEEAVREAPLINTTENVVRYARLRLENPNLEQCHVFYLNHKGLLIMDEIHQTGTACRTAIYPRELIRSALNAHALGMILVHNHPSGDPTPSEEDKEMTQLLVDLMAPLEIDFVDHIILGMQSYFSFKENNFIQS